jgi:hypothetical protein
MDSSLPNARRVGSVGATERPSMTTRRQIAEGFAIDDGAAIHFVDDAVFRVVASRPKARAYRLTRDQSSSGVAEVSIEAEYLEVVKPFWPTL